LMALSLISRQILYYSFCVPDSFSNYRISREVGYSERSIQRMKSEALIEFAEAYKHGKIIAYK
ncbi:ArpU family phage packaging/lysis transcriptional regulator, partial [Enterococcus faecium]